MNPNESGNDKTIRLLNESFRVLEQRVQNLRKLIDLDRRKRNRDHAYVMALCDVVPVLLEQHVGSTPDEIRTAIDQAAAKHLDVTLEALRKDDPVRAASLDDRDAGELPPSPAREVTAENDTAEILSRLASNVPALWQLITLQAAQISAGQIVLCRAVANLEGRNVSDVASEVDRIAAREHDIVIANMAKKHPGAAEGLKIVHRPKPKLDDSSQTTDLN